jgi:hypothetical protein
VPELIVRCLTGDGNVSRTEFELGEDIVFDAWIYKNGVPFDPGGSVTLKYRDPNNAGSPATQTMTKVATGHYQWDSAQGFTNAGYYQATVSTNVVDTSIAFTLRPLAVP